MKKTLTGSVARTVACVLVAGLDFLGFIVGSGATRWLDFAWGLVMAACAIATVLISRQRKADSAMPKNDWINIGYTNGGFISGPVSISTSPPPSTTAKAPKEFAGLPFDFAVGEVYGLRMWRMDHLGRLRARNWHNAEPWRPGVNVAKCVPKQDEDYLSSFMRAAGMASPPKEKPKPTHDVPSENCTCGFYAYTDDRHAETVSYHRNGDPVILGIVKGSGRTLIGTQGFRCEKAEIVALRDPTRGGTKTDPWRLRQLDNLKRVYPDVPLLPSRAALLEFAPLTNTLPDPTTDEFWSLP